MDAAPGLLEQVRGFLNTWQLPNDTRVPVDHLPELSADPQRWQRLLPDVPAPNPADLAGLSRVRDRLRAALGQERPTAVQPLVERGWCVRLGRTLDEPALTLHPEQPTTETVLLSLALIAIHQGQWHRLRACPDCGWVFYDSSRNARRTWCSMTAQNGARGCGSIAKTRAYRTRRRPTHQDHTDGPSS